MRSGVLSLHYYELKVLNDLILQSIQWGFKKILLFLSCVILHFFLPETARWFISFHMQLVWFHYLKIKGQSNGTFPANPNNNHTHTQTNKKKNTSSHTTPPMQEKFKADYGTDHLCIFYIRLVKCNILKIGTS